MAHSVSASFNMVGFWTEWFESGGKTVRIAYLGANLSFEFAAAHQVLKFHSAIQTSSGCISCVKRYDARNISCWNVSTECV